MKEKIKEINKKEGRSLTSQSFKQVKHAEMTQAAHFLLSGYCASPQRVLGSSSQKTRA